MKVMVQYCDARMMRREIREGLNRWPDVLNRIVREYAIPVVALLEEYGMQMPNYEPYTYGLYSSISMDIMIILLPSAQIMSLRVRNDKHSFWSDNVFNQNDLMEALRKMSPTPEFEKELIDFMTYAINSVMNADIYHTDT